MKRPLCILVVALAGLGAAGCGNDSVHHGVDLRNLEPEEVGNLWAEAICEHQSRCGTVYLSCGNGDCEFRFGREPYSECLEDWSDLRPALFCVLLTDAELALLSDCLEEVARGDCPTELEWEEYVRALNNGEEPSPPPRDAPSCYNLLHDLFEPFCPDES